MLAPLAISLPILFPPYAAQTTSSSTQDSSQSPTKRPRVDQSVVVSAHLTPEEVEEGRLNDIYQPIYQFQRTGDCEGIVKTAQSAVIPAAEQAKFETVRKKFLFLSYRSIGDCNFKAKEYADAEQTYIKAVDYADKDDSSYAINFESIALCRMAQQHLDSAEEPLRKAVSLLGDEIIRLKASDTYNADDICDQRRAGLTGCRAALFSGASLPRATFVGSAFALRSSLRPSDQIPRAGTDRDADSRNWPSDSDGCW
jgi:tetratricopeptide (TPR) repeat protein